MSFCRMIFYPVVAALLTSSNLVQAQTEPSKSAPADATASASSEPAVIFKRLRDYVKSNPIDFETSFNAQTQGTELFKGKAHFLIRQPNLLRVETSAGERSYLIVSDGKILTIYSPRQRKYAQMPAPASPAAAVALVSGEMGVESQVLNFIGVVDDVVTGAAGPSVSTAGSNTIGGRKCDRFTVVGQMGDEKWEAWLENSEVPLLCKLNYHNIDGPVQTNEFTWKLNPALPPETFFFSPPEGSTKVDVGSLGATSP